MENVMQEYAGKKIYIPFSGGVDCTLITWMALEAGCNVTLSRIHVNSPQDGPESVRCAKTAEYFISAYGEDRVSFENHHHHLPVQHGSVRNQMFTFVNILPIIVDNTYDHVAMGWVASDATWFYAEDFANQFAEARRWNFAEENKTTIIYPLIKKNKKWIVENLPLELRPLVHWCDTPVVLTHRKGINAARHSAKNKLHIDKPWSTHACGLCPSCIDMIVYRKHFPVGTFALDVTKAMRTFRASTISELQTHLEIIGRAVKDVLGDSPETTLAISDIRETELEHPFLSKIEQEYTFVWDTNRIPKPINISAAMMSHQLSVQQMAALTLTMKYLTLADHPARKNAKLVEAIADKLLANITAQIAGKYMSMRLKARKVLIMKKETTEPEK